MADVLEDYAETVSIGGRTITNLRVHFTDDIDGLAGGEEEELEKLVKRIDAKSIAYGVLISAENKTHDEQLEWHQN